MLYNKYVRLLYVSKIRAYKPYFFLWEYDIINIGNIKKVSDKNGNDKKTKKTIFL